MTKWSIGLSWVALSLFWKTIVTSQSKDDCEIQVVLSMTDVLCVEGVWNDSAHIVCVCGQGLGGKLV